MRSRPCIYERDRGVGEGWELWDRPTFRGARQQADEWVRERLAGRLRPGRITCGVEKPWTTLLAIVGKGKVPKVDEPPESDPEVAARIALQRAVLAQAGPESRQADCPRPRTPVQCPVVLSPPADLWSARAVCSRLVVASRSPRSFLSPLSGT